MTTETPPVEPDFNWPHSCLGAGFDHHVVARLDYDADGEYGQPQRVFKFKTCRLLLAPETGGNFAWLAIWPGPRTQPGKVEVVFGYPHQANQLDVFVAARIVPEVVVGITRVVVGGDPVEKIIDLIRERIDAFPERFRKLFLKKFG